MMIAQHSVHLTAFGVGPGRPIHPPGVVYLQVSGPLQSAPGNAHRWAREGVVG